MVKVMVKRAETARDVALAFSCASVSPCLPNRVSCVMLKQALPHGRQGSQLHRVSNTHPLSCFQYLLRHDLPLHWLA